MPSEIMIFHCQIQHQVDKLIQNMSNIKIFETCETYAFAFLQMMLSEQWKVLPSIIVLILHILIHNLYLNTCVRQILTSCY